MSLQETCGSFLAPAPAPQDGATMGTIGWSSGGVGSGLSFLRVGVPCFARICSAVSLQSVTRKLVVPS